MTDGDFVRSDEDLLHKEPDDTLAFRDVEGIGGLQFAIQRLFLPRNSGFRSRISSMVINSS
ncbi:MAG: hypothetical protein OXH09_23095 [Gammaproteobacteria bacterium]|nr:hypothetical protein [Gammaproteobacteria bacterium]